MTTHSRIAAFLSTSALCLGLVAAPSAFAADATAKVGEGKTQTQSKHHKAETSSAKASHAGQSAKAGHSGKTATSPEK